MAYSVKSRSKNTVYLRKYCISSPTETCDFDNLRYPKTLENEYEYVSSYRGPVQFVNVGDKRRKKFHAFDRYRFSATQSAWKMCDGPNHVAVFEREPIQRFVRSYNNFGDNVPYPNLLGDKVHVSPESLEILGSEARDQVIKDMYVKVNSPRWDGAVFFAELAETVASLHLLLTGTLKMLLKANQSWSYVKHFALNPEELWLWWRYALMPAMLDAEDLIKALKPPKPIDRIQDGLKREWEDTLFVTTGNWWYTIPAEWSVKAKYKLGAGGALDIISLYDPSEWGTSSWDVVRGTWEIIPFSFIFDWFVNFGDWLTTLRDVEVVFAQSYATYAIEAEYEFTSLNGEMQGKNPEIKVFRQRRIIDVEPPRVPLVDHHWRNLLRTVDLITLTVGMLKGVLKKRRR